MTFIYKLEKLGRERPHIYHRNAHNSSSTQTFKTDIGHMHKHFRTLLRITSLELKKVIHAQ